MRGRATSTIVTVLSVLLALTGSVLVPAQAGVPGRSAVTRIEPVSWTVTTHHVPVRTSGGRVRERLGMHVPQTADVGFTIRSLRGRLIRGPVTLAALTPGSHDWTWHGLRNDGTPAPDGRYDVFVEAVFENGARDARHVELLVHRRYHPGSLTSTYPTIYPRSRVVHDATILANRPPEPVRATLRIRNAAGKVVLTRAYKRFRSQLRVRWDGRDGGGRALPAGRYYAKISGVDRDGFTGSTRARRVIVSGKRLVNRTRTVTMAAGENRALDYPLGCNGCSEYPPCGTVEPSVRFSQPGAVSYRSGPGCGEEQGTWSAYTNHALKFRGFAPRGYGDVTVSLFGGPTTPGASDQGYLSVATTTCTTGSSGSRGCSTTREAEATGSDTSDHTTTAPPRPVSVIEDETVGMGVHVPGVWWSFGTFGGASYDVASFTVRFRFLTPQG